MLKQVWGTIHPQGGRILCSVCGTSFESLGEAVKFVFLSSTLNNLFFLFSFFFAQCWFIILPSSPPVSLQLNLSYINLLNLLLCVETVGAEGGASYCQRPPQECSPTVGLDHSQPCGTETQRGKKRNFECVFIYRRTTTCWEYTPRSSNTARVESFFFSLTIETAALWCVWLTILWWTQTQFQ